jgi:hypothetical protein
MSDTPRSCPTCLYLDPDIGKAEELQHAWVMQALNNEPIGVCIYPTQRGTVVGHNTYCRLYKPCIRVPQPTGRRLLDL